MQVSHEYVSRFLSLMYYNCNSNSIAEKPHVLLFSGYSTAIRGAFCGEGDVFGGLRVQLVYVDVGG
jgi:hypothetical protein